MLSLILLLPGNPNLVMALVANKSDLDSMREVQNEVLQILASMKEQLVIFRLQILNKKATSDKRNQLHYASNQQLVYY